uniref:T9SS type A sorting domain-containing protein n=1 Tax=Rufibacter ruber TaxID=1783499 RepID=UPI00082E106E|nr:T9SS type A sorting domain-containing protein [Rufibacter ruber]
MAANVYKAKTLTAFQVWMLVWAFSIFWNSAAVAQTTPSFQAGDYRTTTAGNISQTSGTAQLEQLSVDGTWQPAAYPLPVTSTLYAPHALQIAGPLEVANLVVTAAAPVTVLANAHLRTTGRLTVSPSARLVLQGEVDNRGTLQLQANSTLLIQSHNYQATSSLWAGIEEIDATSEVRIENANASALLLSGSHLTTQPHGFWFGKLTIAPASAVNWQLTNTSGSITAQTATVVLPTGSTLTLAAGISLSLQFGQGLSLTGGTYFVQNQASGTANLSLAGDLALSNASLTLNQTASSGATTLVDLKGHLTQDAGSTINNSSTVTTSSSAISFTGTSWQEIAAAGSVNHVTLGVKPGAQVRLKQHLKLNPSNSVYAGTLTVENGGTLDFGTDANGNGYSVQGQGYFRLEQGGTLLITSAQGINATGLAGNVQVTDSRRTFNQLATFVYSGTVPQQTGNAFTTTANGKILIIDNPTSVTLTQSTGISSNTTLSAGGGKLEIRQGVLIATPTADITSSGKLVMTGGTYRIAMTGTTVPLLSGAYELTGGSIELAGNGDQTLRGKTYHQLIISGSNTAGVNAKTISTTTTVNQKLTILPHALFDIGNKTLKGDGGLTMTGGLLRLGKSSGTLPELAGRNEPYQLTGGTIEFYGTTNGQSQSLRGTYGSSQKITYHHVTLTATEANTLNENGNQLLSGNLDVTGTLTVKAPAVLQIASNRAIGGSGSFVLETGATLLYGSPQGIKQTGTTTSDGNIRVSGPRSYSTQASYGFVGNSEMVSGDGLPATVANLLVAKTGYGVTLTNSVAVSGVFTMKSSLFKTGANELAINSTAPAAIELADPAFYILGNLRRAMGSSGTYSFPVGTLNGKRQLDIQTNALGGNGFQSLLVSFQPLTHHQDADLQVTEAGATYTRIEPEGVWVVEPNTQPTSGSYTAFAYLNGFSGLIDNAFALLLRPLTSTSGKDWNTGGGTLDAPNKEGRTLASGYAKRNFINQFGQLAIGNLESTLPVSWLHVKAQRQQQHVLLTWATATETNNDRFEIEYSLDGRQFTQVGALPGSGHSTTIQRYQFLHPNKDHHVGYYRIKQVDYDGQFEFSKVVSAEAGAAPSVSGLQLYPNPSQEVLYISGVDLAPDAEIEIIDLSGRTVQRVIPVLGGTVATIQVKHLPAGTYLLQLRQEKQVQRQRFVKQ